ncbi:hypothetical protein L0F51_00170 [Afifella sp. H1R]|uniref:hypothetical protein n=1 Tax=Afifella sp. H1R TaxID=2908841 RepID=UPI001F1E73D9|nr:hypothetical protein [Afifella sp. H1R]MCF1502180.1 hypothetical protein [Afifella sp. H1R]
MSRLSPHVSLLVSRAEALVAAVVDDENLSGGLLSRETIRKADELRIEINRARRRAAEEERRMEEFLATIDAFAPTMGEEG